MRPNGYLKSKDLSPLSPGTDANLDFIPFFLYPPPDLEEIEFLF